MGLAQFDIRRPLLEVLQGFPRFCEGTQSHTCTSISLVGYCGSNKHCLANAALFPLVLLASHIHAEFATRAGLKDSRTLVMAVTDEVLLVC